MQYKYYNLVEEPFGMTANPRFLYLSQQHREAIAALAYGTQTNRGFLALIAKPGMGKTSLLYQYLRWLRGSARTAFVFRTDCDSREFMRHMLLDLGVDASGKDLPAMHEALNQLLLEEMKAGRRFVVVIDEAQNLEEKVLESVRLLSNFETPWAKLIQIVIAGQPQLAEKLAKPSLAQLRQRISLIVRLEPFSLVEVNRYIDHRLQMAGCCDVSLFDAGARLLIAERSEGIPRNINNLCFNAMALGCALNRPVIDREIVLEVLADLSLESLIEKEREARPVAQEEKPAPAYKLPVAEEEHPKRKPTRPNFLWHAGATAALIFVAASGVGTGGIGAMNPTAVSNNGTIRSDEAAIAGTASVAISETQPATEQVEDEGASEPLNGTNFEASDQGTLEGALGIGSHEPGQEIANSSTSVSKPLPARGVSAQSPETAHGESLPNRVGR